MKNMNQWLNSIKNAEPRLTRLTTGIAMLLLLCALLLFAKILLWPATIIVILIAGWEWARLAPLEEEREHKPLIGALFLVMLAYYFLGLSCLVLIPLFLPVSLLFLQRSQSHAFLGFTCLSALGVGFLGIYEEFNIYALIWTVAVVIVFDTTALFGGKIIKGPKLWVAVSPDKRWAGLLSGLIFAGICGTLLIDIGKADANLLLGLLASVIVALAAQFGDLAESKMKRRVGIKNTSELLPGHGGILDRIDGFLCAVPMSFLLLSLDDKLQLL